MEWELENGSEIDRTFEVRRQPRHHLDARRCSLCNSGRDCLCGGTLLSAPHLLLARRTSAAELAAVDLSTALVRLTRRLWLQRLQAT